MSLKSLRERVLRYLFYVSIAVLVLGFMYYALKFNMLLYSALSKYMAN